MESGRKAGSRSLDPLEKFRDGQGKGGGQAFDVDEGKVAGATLNIGEIGPVNAGLFGEVFLGQAKLLAPVLDAEAELLANVGCGLLFPHRRRVAARIL
jgi:hypothetical protein